MNKIKNSLPSVIFVLFELAAGILLLRNADAFTKAIVMIFGMVSLILAVVYAISFFSTKKDSGKTDFIAIFIVIPSLIIGIICLFMADWVVTLSAVIFGVILALIAVLKIKNYFDLKKADALVSPVKLISAVLALALGIVIVANPFEAVKTLWIFVGISLIVEAVIDFIGVILTKHE